MRFVLVAGGTATARIDGISAAGADAELMRYTPSADAEILLHGAPTGAPVVPVSPSGCPTPAVVTRAVRELVGFDASVVDAGLPATADIDATTVADAPGADIREAVAVPEAAAIVECAREHGRALAGSADSPPDLWLAETVPGGTTTALGTLAALGEGAPATAPDEGAPATAPDEGAPATAPDEGAPATAPDKQAPVSSSLPKNPLDLKRRAVETGLDASGIERGDHADDPVAAVRAMGDPTLAATLGLIEGATGAGATVTLAGGTQGATAALLARHAGVEAPLALATTSFVADDASAAFAALADAADAAAVVTDPGFDGRDHPAMRAFAAGEAKEGVGMGGALALAERDGLGMEQVRDRVRVVYDRLLADTDRPSAAATGDGP